MNHWLRQNRGFLAFLLCFGLVRAAFADWNPIPSGSMRPTLLEGDVVLVNRVAYDLKLPLTDVTLARLGDPARGDVATFASPQDGTRLIKRIVALPGDTVEMRDEVLYINNTPATYSGETLVQEPAGPGRAMLAIRASEQVAGSERAVQFLPAIVARRSFGPLVVPDDHYFVLGDNRDNSADSRYIGFIARRMLIGRAHHVVVSADITGNGYPRLDRFGERIR